MGKYKRPVQVMPEGLKCDSTGCIGDRKKYHPVHPEGAKCILKVVR